MGSCCAVPRRIFPPAQLKCEHSCFPCRLPTRLPRQHVVIDQNHCHLDSVLKREDGREAGEL